MNATRTLFAKHHQPLIKFIGKRTTPPKVDHAPRAHPMSPTHSLPNTFAQYRQKAQQHGPLNIGLGAIGSHSGKSLGSVEPSKGEVWDRDELPARFRRTRWSQVEIEAIESGGASLFA